MALSYHDIEQARVEAQRTIGYADKAVRQAASLSAGRLEKAGVQGYILEELKRELKNYNIHTGCWK